VSIIRRKFDSVREFLHAAGQWSVLRADSRRVKRELSVLEGEMEKLGKQLRWAADYVASRVEESSPLWTEGQEWLEKTERLLRWLEGD